MQVWTVIGSQVYLITYVSEPENYLNHLTTVQRMVDSFEINQGPESIKPAQQVQETINSLKLPEDFDLEIYPIETIKSCSDDDSDGVCNKVFFKNGTVFTAAPKMCPNCEPGCISEDVEACMKEDFLLNENSTTLDKNKVQTDNVDTAEGDFYIYEDPESGIRIEAPGHPWIEYEPGGPTGDCNSEIVRFSKAIAGSEPLNVYVCVEEMLGQNPSSEEILNRRANSKDLDLDRGATNRFGESVIAYGPNSKLASNPAYELRWKNDTLRNVEMGTVADGKLYIITYRIDPKTESNV